MLLFPLILGLMPEFSEPNEGRGWGPYHSVFRLSHNPAIFTMATHLCYSTLLGPGPEVIRFYSTESEVPISVTMARSTYSLQTHIWASNCSYKIGQNHSTIYLFNFLFICLFILSPTDPLNFDDISHDLKCVISGWPTHGFRAGPQSPLPHKHRINL